MLNIFYWTIYCTRTDEDESDDRDESDNDDDDDAVQGQKSGLFDSGSEGEDVNDIFGGPKPRDKSNFEKRQEKGSVKEN